MTYPRTYDNGGGERLTIVAAHGDGATAWLEVENEIAPGHGPMMHAHHHQEESLTVVEGTLGYIVLGENARTVGAGETVTFPRGVAHRFWNAGDSMLRCRGRISPPLRFEQFIRALYRSMAEHGGRRPGLFDMAFLLHHFTPEGEMVALPRPVRRFVLPALRRIGHATGRYRKYAELMRGA